MKTWFGCTTAKWLEYREYYFAIRDYLKEIGCIILFDWLEDADFRIRNKIRKRDIDKIFQNITRAIRDSDSVIIERTVPGFSASHQITYSLFLRKPTLVLRQPRLNPRFSNYYLDAIDSPYLTIKEYNRNNFRDIINEFIGQSRLEQGPQRYNIVLDKKQKYYLDWASVRHNKSRSSLLRKYINSEIESDKDYKKYIKSNI